jgi:hypothetical protein
MDEVARILALRARARALLDEFAENHQQPITPRRAHKRKPIGNAGKTVRQSAQVLSVGNALLPSSAVPADANKPFFDDPCDDLFR